MLLSLLLIGLTSVAAIDAAAGLVGRLARR